MNWGIWKESTFAIILFGRASKQNINLLQQGLFHIEQPIWFISYTCCTFSQPSLIVFLLLDKQLHLFHNEIPYSLKSSFCTLVALFPAILYFSSSLDIPCCSLLHKYHNVPFRIYLLHLLRFFQPSLTFFFPLANLLQFVAQRTTIFPSNTFVTLVALFFQPSLIF